MAPAVSGLAYHPAPLKKHDWCLERFEIPDLMQAAASLCYSRQKIGRAATIVWPGRVDPGLQEPALVFSVSNPVFRCVMSMVRFISLACLLCASMWTSQTQAQAPISAPKQAALPGAATSAPANPLLQQFGLNADECPGFARLATDYRTKFSAPMKAWAEQKLTGLRAKRVIYPFSGADVVTALALFPKVEHLTLVADQWPEYAGSKQALPGQVAKECATMSYFARYGYFRTNDLEGKNSVKPRFIKLLLYSIALSDAKVNAVDYLMVGPDGAAVAHSALQGIKPDGLRLMVTQAQGRQIKLDYVRMDLSNNGLHPGKPMHAFMSSQMDDTVLIKSASHLLQKPYFSALAQLILERSAHLVQDETGLDIEPFRQVFNIRSYGKFHAPHPLWHNSASGQRLIRYLQDQPSLEPLPFTIGYEKPSGSVLLVGSRKRH